MKKEKESKVIAEVRRIRREMDKEARRVGMDKFIEELNRKRGWLLGKGAKCPAPEHEEAFQVKETAKRKYGDR